MTAVTSHQRLPQWIDEMPLGCAKDLVFQLRGQTNRLVVTQSTVFKKGQVLFD